VEGGGVATKSEFSDEEWEALHKGVTGAGMLVSVSDADFTDSFGEAGALAKFVGAQRQQSESALVRELAAVHGTGFGFTASKDKVEAETIDALRSSVATLSAKAPDELDAYRQFVLGTAEAVAEAKGGVTPAETTAIEAVREALGVAETAGA
jgi:tellurite resistance protein